MRNHGSALASGVRYLERCRVDLAGRNACSFLQVFQLQRNVLDGRIIFTGGKARRGRQKRADYRLRYRPDFPIAVVEAKAAYRQAGDGLQQAKEYAEILGLKFAYATNGAEIIEFDYTTGVERSVTMFPVPDGAAQFKLPEILEVAPFNEWGNVIEIAARFGGGEQLRGAVAELQQATVRRLKRRTASTLAPRVVPCYIWRV